MAVYLNGLDGNEKVPLTDAMLVSIGTRLTSITGGPMPRGSQGTDWARLAAYGAYAVVGALIAAFVVLVAISRPVRTGGITPALAAVTWISTGVTVAALIAAHIALARQLHGRPRGSGP